MSRTAQSWAPFVAIAVLAVGWFLLTQRSPTPEVPPAPVAKAPAPKPESAPPPKTASPEQRSDGSETYPDWPTFHGGIGMTGARSLTLPDRLAARWRYQAEGEIFTTPVSAGERLFFATYNGWVGALDLQGNPVWTRQLMRKPDRNGNIKPDRFEAPAACFGGLLLIGSDSGILYAFEAETGEDRWRYDIDGTILGAATYVPPEKEGDVARIYIIRQDDGALHCVNAADGTELWIADSTDRCDGSPTMADAGIVFGSCAAAMHVYSKTDGTWVKDIEFDADSQVAGGVAVAGDAAFAGSHSGFVFHVNLKAGGVVWTNEEAKAEVFATPAVSGDWVVIGALDGVVRGLERKTGATRWRFDTDGTPTSAVIAGETVVVGADGVLYLLKLASGEKIWSYEVSDEITSPALIHGMIVVGSDDGTVTAFGAAAE